MEYSKFTLGLRFAMTSDANLTPEDCWNVVFAETPITHIQNAHLFGAMDDVAKAESEQAYVCMFSNISLCEGKELYMQLQRKPYLLSFLTIYKPFIQNNLVEKCGNPTYVGEVQEDGAVTGSETAFGSMRFTGTDPEPCNKMNGCKRILIAPDAWEGKFTSADAVRHMLRSAARNMPKASIRTQLIADGGRGTLDALVCSVNGRYLLGKIEEPDGTKTNVRYGILPNETIVMESESLTEEQLSLALTMPQNRGYRHYILGAGGGVLPESIPDGISATVLGKRIPASRKNSSRIEYRNGAETVLDVCGFDFRLRNADWLIVLTHMRDESVSLQDSTTDTLLFHCNGLQKHAAVLAFTNDGRFFAKFDNDKPKPLASRSFDDAADEMFRSIQNFKTDSLPFSYRVPDTILNEM